MQDNDFYNFGESKMHNGSELCIKESISYKHSSDKLSKVITNVKKQNKNIDDCLEYSKQKENKIYKEFQNLINKWLECAKNTNILLQAKNYFDKCNKVKEYKKDFNHWTLNKLSENAYSYSIENKTYVMSFRIYIDKNYRTNEITEYEISYCLYTNDFFSSKSNRSIVFNAKRKAKTKEETEKYIKGRIKAFSKYFQEECPPVLKDYSDDYEIEGVLLEPYRIVDRI